MVALSAIACRLTSYRAVGLSAPARSLLIREVARYLHDRHRTSCLFLSAQAVHARANRHLAWGLVRKPYDFAGLPQIVACAVDLAGGREPAHLPSDLEIFSKTIHRDDPISRHSCRCAPAAPSG